MVNTLRLNEILTSKLILLPGLLIAITFHEIAHGISANLLGDPTAKNAGRLSLNPLAHIDLVGFLLLLTVGFGWAKPVPINPRYFKNRKKGMVIVSFSGPMTNFVLAFIGTVIFAFIIKYNVNSIWILIFRALIRFNIILGLFNLLPFPPLDGSKIFASLLPTKYEIFFYKYERYLYVVLILFIITNVVDNILGPLILFSNEILIRFVMFLLNL